MKKIIIYVKGSDRVGIVSEISKHISSFGGNIENSKMIKLEHKFYMILLINIDDKNQTILKKKLSEISNLEINIDLTEQEESIKNNNIFSFTLKGADNEGIVYKFTKLLSDSTINIIDMETKLFNAPITGHPLFYMESKILIPEHIDLEKIKEKLELLSEQENVVIKLIKASINH